MTPTSPFGKRQASPSPPSSSSFGTRSVRPKKTTGDLFNVIAPYTAPSQEEESSVAQARDLLEETLREDETFLTGIENSKIFQEFNAMINSQQKETPPPLTQGASSTAQTMNLPEEAQLPVQNEDLPFLQQILGCLQSEDTFPDIIGSEHRLYDTQIDAQSPPTIHYGHHAYPSFQPHYGQGIFSLAETSKINQIYHPNIVLENYPSHSQEHSLQAEPSQKTTDNPNIPNLYDIFIQNRSKIPSEFEILEIPSKFKICANKPKLFITPNITEQTTWSQKAGYISQKIGNAKKTAPLHQNDILCFMLADMFAFLKINRNVNIEKDLSELHNILCDEENKDIKEKIEHYLEGMQVTMKQCGINYDEIKLENFITKYKPIQDNIPIENLVDRNTALYKTLTNMGLKILCKFQLSLRKEKFMTPRFDNQKLWLQQATLPLAIFYTIMPSNRELQPMKPDQIKKLMLADWLKVNGEIRKVTDEDLNNLNNILCSDNPENEAFKKEVRDYIMTMQDAMDKHNPRMQYEEIDFNTFNTFKKQNPNYMILL